MAQVQQRLLAAGTFLLLAAAGTAQKFYPDDPIPVDPAPLPAKQLKVRQLSEYFDFFWHTFAEPGEKQPARGDPIPARGVNTLGEVPDGAWYTNRHGRTRMPPEALRRGPDTADGPAQDGPWTVVSAKTEGVTPGFKMMDSRGQMYLVKVDPKTNPNMATAADVIGAKFFYALGYNVPENYIIRFERDRLAVDPEATFIDAQGKKRHMHERDVDEVLYNVPRDSDGQYRAVASKYVNGKAIGPFRFHGVRLDDPNDIVPHEQRRDLRGLFVFAAWLGHNDVKSLNNIDCVVEENGVPFVRHYLIDFGAAFGSDSFTAKSPRAGNQYLFAVEPSIVQIATLGLYVPRWAKAHYRKLPEAGNFECDLFDPERWRANYPNPAFDNRLPDDTFWAARQVMAFRDEEIRGIVETGRYRDPESVDWITHCLIVRRDKIGRIYFARLLPLDRFAVRDGQLVFEDLAVKYGFTPPRPYQVQWSLFDNRSRVKTPISGATTLSFPEQVREAQPGTYFAADIRADDPMQSVTAYLRRQNSEIEVVGIDRRW